MRLTTMMRARLCFAVVLFATLAIALPAMSAASGPGATTTLSRNGAGRILGSVWDAKNAGIPSARVRLRNVSTGRIEAVTVSNEAGQFTFVNVEGGNYVLEVVNAQGAVLGVGQTFVIGGTDTVATFVRLGSKVPWFSGFFNNAAAGAVATAATVGVTAVSPGQPSSAGR